MTSQLESSATILLNSPRRTAVALALLCALTMIATQPVRAQTFSVLHTFIDGADGANPDGGLTIDSAGNLYGTAANGGTGGAGTVYKLTHSGSGWTLSPLYSFSGGSDGAYPIARVTIGTNGTLYGSTASGGQGSCNLYGHNGCGTVFNLRPPASICKAVSCSWAESVLYRFTSGNDDGADPGGDLTFDQSGNLYGGTTEGGCTETGVVYELTAAQGSWLETVVFCPNPTSQGAGPNGGVIFDRAGNIYGVLGAGPQGSGGAVYELTPSGGGWNETTLYDFPNQPNDGHDPVGGLIMDSVGNLFGTTSAGGSGGGGTVFELSPSQGGWIYNGLYSFTGNYFGPLDKLTMDTAGNLYGTRAYGGEYGYGSVFKLTPSGGGWTYTDLHDFTGETDGGYPQQAGVVLDSSGNIYGTVTLGGDRSLCYQVGCGVVWEITP